MFRLFKKLYAINLLTPVGLYRLASSVSQSGINLMALFRYAARSYPGKTALVDEQAELTYAQLLSQTEQLSAAFREEYNIKKGQKIAIACRNHASLVRAIFSVSALGADIYLLNPEIGSIQFNEMITRHFFELIIHDNELTGIISKSSFKNKTIPAYHNSLPSIDSLARTVRDHTRKINRTSSGKIIVLTGGTSGNLKTAARKPSFSNYTAPFFTLISKLNITPYNPVYIATPVYHGFGLAAMFMSFFTGAKVFLTPKFEARHACDLVDKQKIEVLIVVPLMLSRMIHCASRSLASLNCIISGGDILNPKLVEETMAKTQAKLFNLYGTSEAGFCILATPEDLAYSAKTIGKPITGARVRMNNADNRETTSGSIGRLCIKSRWTINNALWIDTGDLAYKDKNGYYFLCGRVDDMIVSGGENVYPIELEHILAAHEGITQVAVVGIPDNEFGQRLKAFIVPVSNNKCDPKELIHWLATRATRHQMPKQITYVHELPYTSLGKPDRKALVQVS